MDETGAGDRHVHDALVVLGRQQHYTVTMILATMSILITLTSIMTNIETRFLQY